jgi:hypothetical protein
MTAPQPETLRVARRWIAKAEEDLAAAERLLAVPLAELAALNRYAVEARYPIGDEPITGEEARAAIAVARRVRAAALRAVGPVPSQD